jgi:hypothetical protein
MTEKTKTKHPIFSVLGPKGGVGKSTVACNFLDLLGPSAILIETDTSNPDVGLTYQDTNKTCAIDLDHSDGWIDLVNLADSTDEPLVINGAARSNAGLKHAPILTGALNELGRKLVVLFVMSRSRDSMELLADNLEIMPADVAETWPVLNTYFGSPDRFTLYNDSNMRRQIEARTGTLVFPDLTDRIMEQMNHGRLTIAKAAEIMPIGNRMELLRWRNEAHAELQKVIE